MKYNALKVVAALSIPVIIALLGFVVATSSWLDKQDRIYQFLGQKEVPSSENHVALTDRLRQKAAVYIAEIEDDLLVDGMIVGRDIVGNPLHICDSLLFSSLYYVSLVKLGYTDLAAKAWQAIEKSQTAGHWHRHPRCAKQPTSRDMIMGILVAFSQNPANKDQHIRETLAYVKKHDGFISNGRVDVSYLTPGVAEFFRVLAMAEGIEKPQLPLNIDLAFSTSEFSALSPNPGYRLHLVGLQMWLEMEMAKQFANFRSRNSMTSLDPLAAFTGTQPAKQRLAWITQKIYTEDPGNLFFKYLRMRAANALSNKARGTLMAELLTMEQFPNGHLPEDCDRDSDYLWQRSSEEYYQYTASCSKTFTGVDFLWMAGLLLESEKSGLSQESLGG